WDIRAIRPQALPPHLVELVDLGLERLPLLLRQALELRTGLEEVIAERVGDLLLQVARELELRGALLGHGSLPREKADKAKPGLFSSDGSGDSDIPGDGPTVGSHLDNVSCEFPYCSIALRKVKETVGSVGPW